MNALVSVILTSYNKGKFLKESLESVLNQTHSNLEIFVIDNNSNDGSVEYLETINDPRLSFSVNSKNLGSVRSINKALSQNLKGEYIAIQHGDDIWHPKKIETQLGYLRKQNSWSACFTGTETIDAFGKPLEDHSNFYFDAFNFSFQTTSEGLNRLLTHGNFLCMPSILFKNNVLKELGYFNETYALLPDFDMWIKLFSRYQVGITTETLTKFRVGSDNESAFNSINLNRSRNEAFIILNGYLNSTNSNLTQRETINIEQVQNHFREATSDMARFALLSRLSAQANQAPTPENMEKLRTTIDEFEPSEIRGLRTEVESLNSKLVSIQNSRSWKITSPIRAVLSKLGNFKSGGIDG